uniref:IMV membrane protein n=1 Tax=Rousettus bat poxvirus TaxID=3141933 RepID=A0AAU7E248_9POXV
MLVPAISDKLRVEYRAFSEISRATRDRFVCVDDTLATFSFTPFGVVAMVPVSATTQTPLGCAARAAADTAKLVPCESRDGLARLTSVCEKAYAELFFSL